MDIGALLGRRKAPTFGEYADYWLRMRASKLQPSSLTTYRRMIDLYLRPGLGALRLTAITRHSFREWFAGLMASRPLAPATLDIILNVALMIFGWAEDEEILESNPARKVKEKMLPREREDARPAKAMTREQLAAFLAVVRRDEPAYYPSLLFMSRMGLRISECLALAWQDVDLDARRITVARSKNGRRRGVPLTSDMAEMLATMARAPRGPLVFAMRDGEAPSQSSLRAIVKRCAGTAGIGTHWHPHSLRHGWASILEQEGADLSFISRLAGHTDLRTTSGYAHNLPPTGWDVVDRLVAAVPAKLPDAPAAVEPEHCEPMAVSRAYHSTTIQPERADPFSSEDEP